MAEIKPSDLSQSREIRIFVSSTFKDMQAERDVLVKHIFPQLRKICEQRGAIFTEVDLRWGITDEQKAEGKVLPICLAEIENCRPYFIGILGERYGWVPDSLSTEILEQQGWLQDFSGRSVTELEIFHGVLNNPEMAEHAYFYFRDPIFGKDQQQATGDGSEKSLQEETRKQNALKDRIRKSGFPVKENYTSPQELGEMVLGDMQDLIDRLFPQEEICDPMLNESAGHEMYAANLARTYIKNQDYFVALNRHVEGSGAPLVVLGESGSGKSALLANWVRTFQKANPDSFILAHFIGASPFSSNWVNMLQRVLMELKKKFEIQENIPEKPDELRAVFAKWLNMIATENKLILVLDALNQLEDRDGALDLVWLPVVLPDSVRLIVSTLPGRTLDEIKKRSWSTLEIKTLGVEDRKQMIHEYLAQYKKSLNSDLTSLIANNDKSSNPLFLRTVLEEMRVFGSHEELKTRTEYYLKSQNILELFEKILVRYETDYEGENPGMVGRTLSLIWASRHGLHETEILELLGKDELPLPRASWTPFFLSTGQALVNHSGFIGFGHDYFRAAVYSRYIKDQDGQKKAHLCLAEYFAKDPTSPRSLEEYAWQLLEAQAWEKLYLLLKEPEFFKKAWNLNHYDVTACWLGLEKNTDFRIVNGYDRIIQTPENYQNILVEVSSLLTQTGNFAESQHLLETILQSTVQESNPTLSETAYQNLGFMAFIRGDFKKALSFYKTQEKLCRDNNHLNGLQHALGAQGMILNANGDLSESLKYSKEQENICRQNGFISGLQSSLSNQGKIATTRGELNNALKLFQEQEKTSLSCGDISGLQSAYSNQGNVYFIKEDLDEALRLYKRAEDLTRNWLGDLNALQSSIGDQGLILRAKKDPEGAMKLYKDQEEICKKLGDKIGLSTSLGNQGLVMQDMGKRESALQMFKEQENICQQTGYKIGLQNSLGNQGMLLFSTGNPDKALDLLDQQEKICRDLGYKAGLQRCLDQKAQVLLWNKGNTQAALSIYEELEKMFKEEQNLEGLQNVYARQANIQAQGNAFMETMLNKKGDEIRRKLAQEGNPHFVAYTTQATVIRTENVQNQQPSPVLQSQFDLKKMDDQAKSLMDRGDWNDALKIYEQKVEICRRLQNKPELDKILTLEEKIYEADGNWEAVIGLKKAQIQIAREMNNLMRLNTVLNSYVEILKARGEIDEALQVYKEIEISSRARMANPGKIAIFTSISQIESTSAMLEQAKLVQALGDLDEALRLFKEIEKLYRNVNDANGICSTMGHEAAILAIQNDYKNALALLQEAEPLKKRAAFGNPVLMAQGINQVIDYKQAELLYLAGVRNQALAAYDKQEAHCIRLKNMDELQKLLGYKADVIKKSGDLSTSLEICKKRQTLCLQNENLFGLQGTLGTMAAIYEDLGEFEKALSLNQERESICQRINNPYNLFKAKGDQLRLLAKMGDGKAFMFSFGNFENECKKNGFAEEPYFVLLACEKPYKQHADSSSLEDFDKKIKLLKTELKVKTSKEITPELIDLVRFSRQQLQSKADSARKERENAIQKGAFIPKLDNSNLENEYKLLENQARGLQPKQHFDRLLQIYQKQQQLSLQSNDKIGLGKCYCNLGVLYKENGDLDKAMNFLLESEKIYREIIYMEGLQYVLENQGVIFKLKNDLLSALRKFEEQAKICRVNNYPIKLLSALNEASDINKMLHDYNKAFDSIKEKYDLCQKSGAEHDKIKAFNDLAWIYEWKQDFDKALEVYLELEKFCRTRGYSYEDLTQNQGNLFFLKGNWQEAYNTYSKQYNQFYKSGYIKELGLQNVLSHQAMVLALKGGTKDAKEIYKEIGKIGSKSTHIENPEDLSNFKNLLSTFEKQEQENIASEMKGRLIISLVNQGLIYYYGVKQQQNGLNLLKRAEDLAQSEQQFQGLKIQLAAWQAAVKTFFWKR